MKKIIFTLLLLSSVVSMGVKANPIIMPPIISELYFDNNDWQLELNFDINSVMMHGIHNSDSLFLITSTDTAGFKTGWTIDPDIIIVITKDSLLSPITINKNGDRIFIAIKHNGQYSNYDLGCPDFFFGNYQGAHITAPLPGQSLKRLSACDYLLAKDSHPTLGYDPYNASTTASLDGYVYDSNHNPFPYAHVWGNNCSWFNLLCDSNGYFHCSGLYAFYTYMYACAAHCPNADTYIVLEPDITTHLSLIFDSCYYGIHNYSKPPDISLQVFPNPGSGNFTFVINTTQASKAKQLIKIYDAAGELVNIIPVGDVNSTTVSVPWDGKGKYSGLAAGIYNCSLEMNGRTLASVKLVIDE